MVRRGKVPDSYVGPERREPKHWYFKKEVSVEALLTILTICGSMLFVGRSFDQRVLFLENDRSARQEREKEREDSAREARGQIADQLKLLSTAMQGLQGQVGQLQIAVTKVEAKVDSVVLPASSSQKK